MVKRILTGIRPTGALHLGHYAGALQNWVRLQNQGEYECFFLIADIQALTTHIDQAGLIEESVHEVVLDWLACGLKPSDSTFFVLQSQIPELTELTAYLTLLTSVSELESNPTIKEEKAQMGLTKISAGFFIYPVSQAADILLFTTVPVNPGDQLLVPVGEDQLPHIELSRDMARRFNRIYEEVFLIPEGKVSETPRLVGTDGDRKMGKSYGNAIFLKDEPEVIWQRVMGMFTDPLKARMGDSGHPGGCPCFQYHEAFGGEDIKALFARRQACEDGSLGCVQCKKELNQVLMQMLGPIHERRKEFEIQPEIVKDALNAGTRKARSIAKVTMALVREAMHLDYLSVL